MRTPTAAVMSLFVSHGKNERHCFVWLDFTREQPFLSLCVHYHLKHNTWHNTAVTHVCVFTVHSHRSVPGPSRKIIVWDNSSLPGFSDVFRIPDHRIVTAEKTNLKPACFQWRNILYALFWNVRVITFDMINIRRTVYAPDTLLSSFTE